MTPISLAWCPSISEPLLSLCTVPMTFLPHTPDITICTCLPLAAAHTHQERIDVKGWCRASTVLSYNQGSQRQKPKYSQVWRATDVKPMMYAGHTLTHSLLLKHWKVHWRPSIRPGLIRSERAKSLILQRYRWRKMGCRKRPQNAEFKISRQSNLLGFHNCVVFNHKSK